MDMMNMCAPEIPIYYGFRARRKRTARSLSKTVAKILRWFDSVAPILFGFHLPPTPYDDVRKDQYYAKRKVLLSNWNIFCSSAPILDNFSRPWPTRVYKFLKHYKPKFIENVWPNQVTIRPGPSFLDFQLYQKTLYYCKVFPHDNIWTLLCKATWVDPQNPEWTEGAYRTFIFDSNLKNPKTGRMHLGTKYRCFAFHCSYKLPQSIGVGPCIRKKKIRVYPPNYVPPFCYTDEPPYQHKEILEYLPREFVLWFDMRFVNRICCGTYNKLCWICMKLMAPFASIISTVIHELFVVRALTAFYDGGTGVYIVCWDHNFWSKSKSERKQMVKLVRTILLSTAEKRMIPVIYRGLVSRVSEMFERLLIKVYSTFLIGAEIGQSNTVLPGRVMNFLKHTGLKASVLYYLKKMVETPIRCDVFTLEVLEILKYLDKLRLKPSFSYRDSCLKSLFKLNVFGLDELPLKDMIWPCPFSINPFTNNLIVPLRLEYPVSCTLEMQPMPVLFTDMEFLCLFYTEDTNYFPSMFSYKLTYLNMSKMVEQLVTIVSFQKKNLIMDCNIYHLIFHYTKYDRYLCAMRCRQLLENEFIELQYNPYKETHFASIFKQKNIYNLPYDLLPREAQFRNIVMKFLMQILSTDLPEPLRLSHRYLRALMLSSAYCILVNSWYTAFPDDPPKLLIKHCVPNEQMLSRSCTFSLFRPLAIFPLSNMEQVNIANQTRQTWPYSRESWRSIDRITNIGYSPHELQLHLRAKNYECRARQAPLGMSSGNEQSTTSSDTSEYYSTDSEKYVRRNSIDHFQSFASATSGPHVFTCIYNDCGERNKGTISMFLRAGTVETTYTHRFGQLDTFLPAPENYFTTYRWKKNYLRAERPKIVGAEKREADAMRQNFLQETVTMPNIQLYPPAAFYRFKEDPGYLGDIECLPEFHGHSRRKRKLVSRGLRSKASTRLSRLAQRGHYSWRQSLLDPDKIQDLYWPDDSQSNSSEGNLFPGCFWPDIYHERSRNFTGRCKNVQLLRCLETDFPATMEEFKSRILRNDDTDSSGSIWASASLHTNKTYVERIEETDNQLKLLKHFQRETAQDQASTIPSFLDYCYESRGLEAGFTSQHNREHYNALYKQFGEDGRVLYPSSDDENSGSGTAKKARYGKGQLTYTAYFRKTPFPNPQENFPKSLHAPFETLQFTPDVRHPRAIPLIQMHDHFPYTRQRYQFLQIAEATSIAQQAVEATHHQNIYQLMQDTEERPLPPFRPVEGGMEDDYHNLSESELLIPTTPITWYDSAEILAFLSSDTADYLVFLTELLDAGTSMNLIYSGGPFIFPDSDSQLAGLIRAVLSAQALQDTGRTETLQDLWRAFTDYQERMRDSQALYPRPPNQPLPPNPNGRISLQAFENITQEPQLEILTEDEENSSTDNDDLAQPLSSSDTGGDSTAIDDAEESSSASEQEGNNVHSMRSPSLALQVSGNAHPSTSAEGDSSITESRISV
ncbi:MAG: EO2-4 [Arowana adomavirus]|uniref:EO2-4 n=1 Tax=Arowana adomavirus TaxID=2219223 RepID=A0A2U9Q1W6_9VIRU|nr:MAG: EO2-4 [Arowana adomavirus]